MPSIRENLNTIQAQIQKGAERSGREPEEIRLMAVSKTFGLEAVREAYQAGQRLFGENRIQEAEQKIPGTESWKGICWHLIGSLQSNKAARAAHLFHTIETVDRPKIARKLSQVAGDATAAVRVYVQINVGGETQKHGVAPEQARELTQLVTDLPGLDLAGLMTIPPYSPDPEQTRPYFRKLRQLRDQLQDDLNLEIRDLSMGMSNDFTVAIEEGATLLRLGTAIFGARSPQ